jgi:prevent-host-death family protein
MTRTQVGIRELKNGLSRFVARVRRGEEIVVTERGTPVARLVAVKAGADPLAALIADGLVEAPERRRSRRLQQHRVRLRGRGPSMAAYVTRQRR